jgi:hypothetical protein
VPAATGLTGLVAGFLIGGHAGESRPAGDARPPVVVFSGADAAPSQLPSTNPVTLDDLRRVVREELAALPATGNARAGNAVEAAAAAPTPEQSLAADQARAVLGSALARRSWTDNDREALSPQFAAMSPAQREEWLQQYAQAVNQGRLVPESELPPF